MKIEKSGNLFAEIRDAILTARNLAYKSSNTILLNMYWEIGRIVVENEQQGKSKAEYGQATLKNLSAQLTLEFGAGFDESNLRNIRRFYLAFQKRDALRHELSWTHYRIISRLENEMLRRQYIERAIEGNWDTRTLQRNVKTNYVGRILDTESK